MMTKSLLIIGLSLFVFNVFATEYADFDAAKKAGDTALRARQWDDAINAYRMAIDKAGNQDELASAIFQCGTALFRQRKFEEAEVEFQKIIEMDNPPIEYVAGVHTNRGTFLRWCKRYDQAIAEYEKVLAIDNIDDLPKAQALTLIGLCLRAQNKHEEMIVELEKISSLRVSGTIKNNADLSIAESMNIIKKYDEALDIYKSLLNNPQLSGSQRLRALKGQGDVLFRRREFETAAVEYEKILEIPGAKPADHAQARIMMGRCFLELNEKAKAKGSFERAQAIIKDKNSPLFKEAEDFLKRINK